MTDEIAEDEMELDTSTKLAYDRTRLAYENTMMAWVRTATSLITFGFSVYKFFQFDTKGAAHIDHLVGPRGFALMMISFGVISLAAGTVQHITNMRHLRAQNPEIPRSIASLLAFLISFLGLFALLAVLFRQ